MSTPSTSQTSPDTSNHSHQDKVRELDEILGGFSDSADRLPSRPDPSQLWKDGDTSQAVDPSVVAEAYAPLHLKEQFEDLYRVLHPALLDRRHKKNASAFLQGARGSGKSLTLHLVLRALQAETQAKAQQQQQQHSFRVVRLNGILVPGNQVALCVQEILRQLTAMAQQEQPVASTSTTPTAPPDGGATAEVVAPPRKKPRRSQRAKELVRLRKACFTNQIQLLNEILQFACLDGIPILFVLDELDAFVKATGGTNFAAVSSGDIMDRQLLLYHLLDRVATDSSLVSLVGLTCHNGTMSLLEKRIRSRAEGTTRFLYFGPLSSVQEWYGIIANKLQTQQGNAILAEWQALVTTSPHATVSGERQQILDCFNRSLNLGHSVRWLFRVMVTALKLYRHDLMYGTLQGSSSAGQSQRPSSLQSCLFQSMTRMGAPFLSASGERKLARVGSTIPDARIQALGDLAGPQVALVLAARRILARDSHRENTAPLTLERILEEYKSYKGNSNRYSRPLLLVSFRDLLATGLIRPGSDHSGTAPLRYHMDPSFSDLTAPTAGKIELHLNFDIHREFQQVIDLKLLDCSIALLEWGKRTT